MRPHRRKIRRRGLLLLSRQRRMHRILHRLQLQRPMQQLRLPQTRPPWLQQRQLRKREARQQNPQARRAQDLPQSLLRNLPRKARRKLLTRAARKHCRKRQRKQRPRRLRRRPLKKQQRKPPRPRKKRPKLLQKTRLRKTSPICRQQKSWTHRLKTKRTLSRQRTRRQRLPARPRAVMR